MSRIRNVLMIMLRTTLFLSCGKAIIFVFTCSLLYITGCKNGNNPPDMPLAPLGPSSGDIGNYTFRTTTTDPDGDSIACKFDWGDGTMSQWSAYRASGDTITTTHFYGDSGFYQIRAQAKDEAGAESDWSDPHMLDISRAFLWRKAYGGAGDEYGYSVKENTAGEYVIVGYTASYGAGGFDVYLIKTDADGNLIDEDTYGGSNDDAGYSVWETIDGGYIITGYTNSYGAGHSDVYLIKTDVNGFVSWEQTYGGGQVDHGYSVQETADGGYIISGKTASYGAGGFDVYLIKTDVNGDTLWTKTYGGAEHDCGYAVRQTTDGGYVVTGYTASSGAGGDDVYLIKTDANGNVLWSKTYGTSDDDRGHEIQQTSDGGYIIAAGNRDVYCIKTDANGGTVWEKTYGGAGYLDWGHSVQKTMDGGYIVAGYTGSFNVSVYDVYLIKTDANGTPLWERTCGDWRFEYGYSVCETADGSYVVTGATNSHGAGGFDVYLIKSAP